MNRGIMWYRRQVRGLLMIINENAPGGSTIHRSYVEEKLTRIINGTGIGFHPIINTALDELRGEDYG